jgi:N6-adenosine-specific RNA methylase IME4
VRYRTIVADPPWRYRSTDILTRGWRRTASVETAKSMTAEGHYTTMTNAEIAALPVGGLADDPACLFLWVTNPRLYGERDGTCSPHEIAAGWGFRYVTMLTWVKTGPMGLGFYFRGQTEHVLFCVRGDFRIPPKVRESNVVTAPRRGHSEKPDAFYDLVERVCPGPYVELFARRARFGWDYWGDESLGTAEMAHG